VVTAGATGALLIATGVLINPGDEILIPDPADLCNCHFVRFFEVRVTAIPVGADTRYHRHRKNSCDGIGIGIGIGLIDRH
jgi:aspartate/methionine/tyrosine aminotransferase